MEKHENKHEIVHNLQETLRATLAYPEIVLRYVEGFSTEKRYQPNLVIAYNNEHDLRVNKPMIKINVEADSGLYLVYDVMRKLK